MTKYSYGDDAISDGDELVLRGTTFHMMEMSVDSALAMLDVATSLAGIEGATAADKFEGAINFIVAMITPDERDAAREMLHTRINPKLVVQIVVDLKSRLGDVDPTLLSGSSGRSEPTSLPSTDGAQPEESTSAS